MQYNLLMKALNALVGLNNDSWYLQV